MSINELLGELDRRNIRLWVEGGKLKFHAPKGAMTAELRDQVRAFKQALIDSLQTAQETDKDEAPPIAPYSRDADSEPPLSYAQQRLWFVDQFMPPSAAYNMKLIQRFLGPLDAAALSKALDRIAARHESLRTVFPADEYGRPRQTILPPGSAGLRLVDFTDLRDGEDGDQAARQFCADDSDRPFKLAKGPLFRPLLCRIAPDNHILVIAMHHIISDGWSLDVFIGEMIAAYSAFVQDREPALPPLAVQYADFAQWQRDWLSGERLEKQVSYWTEQLKAPRAVLAVDHPRPEVQTLEGSAVPIHLPRALSDRLNALAQAEGVTMFMILLAAYDIILWGYSGQEDLLVGTVTAGRDRAEVEPLIGFFVNTLVLRLRLDRQTSLRQALARSRETVLQAYAHQDVPYEKVVEELNPERNLSRNLVFQAMFSFRVLGGEASGAGMSLPGLTTRGMGQDVERSIFELTLSLDETPHGLLGGVNYNVALFDKETAERMASMLPQVLEGFLGDLDQPIARFEWLPEGKRARLFFERGPMDKRGPAALHALQAAAREALGNVPVGVPFANSRIYLLDEDFNPVPLGSAGELCIGGEGLARGYFGQPQQTAVRFAPDPFSSLTGARLYRSGDLARFLPDGHLEFLGRVDFQVKVRGFRIELGEIEETLNRHPAVAKTVVRAVDGGPAGKRLVGYVQAKSPKLAEEPLKDELHDFLEGRLPDYMIPSAFVLLARFPLTPNGKIDMKALPVPDPGQDRGAEATGPRTTTELLLAEIWSEVLGVADIGVFDNFFRLGGHSLLAAQAMARLRRAFKTDLPLRTLFEAPTIAQLAAEIESRGEGAAALPPIEPLPPERRAAGDLPLSFQQQRLWFLARLEPDNPAYNMPMSWQLLGVFDPIAYAKALQALVARHEALRTLFPMAPGAKEPTQVILGELEIPLPLIDFSGLPEETRDQTTLALANAFHRRPFDLAHGPLVRGLLLRRQADDHALLFGMHHIISDGWSMDVFTAEITQLYRGFALEQETTLPPLPVQYADYASWQRAWFQGGELDRQLTYWRKKLSGRLPVLPTDEPRPEKPTVAGSVFPFQTDAELTAAAAALARAEGCTLFMVYLTALKLALAAYSGERDAAVGTPIANRNQPEIEPLIGFFVNTLALRTAFGPDPSLRSLLHRVRETALGAFAHQETPFERLVQEINPVRDQRISPLFQVMWIFEEKDMAAAAEEAGQGFRLVPFEGDVDLAIFDITFSFHHTAQGGFGTVVFKRELFEQATIETLTAHFTAALQAMSAGLDRRLKDLPFLAAADRGPHRAARDKGRNVPIGSPFPNSRVFILDGDLNAAPPGAPGELCIGGEGLARGYFGRQRQTALKFIPDPFAQTAGGRLYRSGDLARWLPDGSVEFIGRVDFQVKVRGFRIELGDIEEALNRHPAVRKSVVRALSTEGAPNDKRLVGYVTLREEPADEDLFQSELRAFLGEQLPDYMVPTALVTLESFPLTPNGKIDMKALPIPERGDWRADREQRPLSPMETMIADIWAEVLDLTQPGPEDNFFELGGHSLLVTRVVSQIRQLFEVDLPIKALFDFPTVAGLTRQVEAARGAAAGVAAPPIKPVPRDPQAPGLPVSFSQRRMWFLNRLEPENASYNIPSAIELTGPFDEAAFQQALDDMAARHETLRTHFVSDGDEPLQRIGEPHLPLRIVDLQDLPGDRREDAARRLLLAEGGWLFDLERGPLTRCLLLRMTPARRILLTVMHHVVSDGWSMNIFTREIQTCYRARMAGRKPHLPPLPIQYADFAHWQRNWLQGETLERILDYWRTRLSGMGPLDVPCDKPRPKMQTFAGAAAPFVLDAELSHELRELSRKTGVTMFMTLLAAFKILLGRYAGQGDVQVGAPIANRNRAETEGLIGFFVNALVLRTDLSDNPAFDEALRRVRDTALGAYAHQDMPFELLVQELQPKRDPSRSPLFQALFNLQTAEAGGAGSDDGDGGAKAIAGEAELIHYDLELALLDDGHKVQGSLHYNTALYEAGTIERMTRHFALLLEAMRGGLDQRVMDVSLMTAEERRLALEEWNDTARDFAFGPCLHAFFEQRAAQAPDRPALYFEDETLSYGELNRRANRWAHRLRELGVGPDAMVGVYMARSFDMIASLLAILKAGGAYVPLDPAYPQERLAFMIEDARMPVVFAQSDLETELPASEARALYPDREAETVADLSEDNPVPLTCDGNLAFIVYTSGSTGRPKGVRNTHRGAVNRYFWYRELHPLTADDRCCQKTSLNFVDSVAEIFNPLMQGASLLLVPDDTVKDAERFVDLLAAHGATRVLLAPPLMRTVLEAVGDDGDRLVALRIVETGGEAVTDDLLALFHRTLPGRTMVNLYGMSEVSPDLTWADYREDDPPRPRPPIGKPIANARTYILDQALRPLPIGVPGELHAAGELLSQGYLNLPAMTAERFVPNPFSGKAGDRLYKTGDQCRFWPDGAIDYLGRIDHQVKIRGFRIELGEIETRLNARPEVRVALALARRDQPGEPRLAAYIQPTEAALAAAGYESERALHAAETMEQLEMNALAAKLRETLVETLPEYMIPSAFVFLAALPLTPSGKVSRLALPVPERYGELAEYAPPATETEQTIAEVWGELLDLKRIGVNDQFFLLGGHSLLATSVLSRLRRRFGIDLPLRVMFNFPTLGELAEEIDQRLGQEQAEPKATDDGLKPVPRESGKGLPLSYAQQQLWFIDRMEPGNPAYNLPFTHLMTGPLDAAALNRALDAMVARHESLRTVFREEGDQPVQLVLPPAPAAFAVIDLSGLPQPTREATVRALAARDAAHRFDLTRGPLLRLALVRLDGDAHAMLLNMHHIISDGWSTPIFVGEITACYDAYSRGVEPALPPLPIQYPDFSVWQRGWLQGETLTRFVDHWREKLAGHPNLELPTDFPRPKRQSFRGADRPFVLEPELTAKLRALGQSHDATLFMTLLAGFHLLLARYSGQDDIVVGAPIANRNREETERLIGYFANTLPLRLNLSDAPSFVELLKRERLTALDAFEYQDLPFEKLVAELQPKRDLSRNPIFQAAFAVNTGGPAPSGEAAEAATPEAATLGVAAGIAHFDLYANLMDTGDRVMGSLEFCIDLFKPETIDRMLAHYRELLAAMAADPNQATVYVDMLTAEERNRVLKAWNDTHQDHPSETPVHALVEARAAAAPDSLALADDQREWTYGELNRRANQLAHAMTAQGVGPGKAVAICLRPSLETAAAALAALKIGAAYLPLDPTNPPDRLRFMLADANAAWLVVAPDAPAQLADWDGPGFIAEEAWDLPADTPDDNPQRAVDGAAAAYVIYTSGSTGQPKGVIVSHAALLNLVGWHRRAYAVEPASRATLLAGPAFDASVWELWPYLTAGASIHVPKAELRFDPAGLWRWFGERAVTHSFVPTPLAEALLAEKPPQGLALRWLLTGGDRLQRRPAEGFPVALINHYGPTENAVVATCGPVTPGDGDRAPSIGRPIDNNRVYLLDRHAMPAPPGASGELTIAGASLARGYLGRPDLTAERFRPDPFAEEPGARLYFTGDQARFEADGRIAFLGRGDHQVKIRGYRVELGEIEAALAACENVAGAVVVLHEQPSGEAALTGYVQPESGSLDPEQLRQKLAGRLPDYMVPAVVMALEQFPLTPNGKIDRRALPQPELAATPARPPYAPPRTAAEKKLAKIWSELLGMDKIGLHDNFFEIGGHSLLATRAISRIRQTFKVETPVPLFFENPTIAELAPIIFDLVLNRMEEDEAEEGSGVQAPIKRLPRRADQPGLPLSFAQQRLWFLYRMDPGSTAYNIFGPFPIEAPFDAAAFERAFDHVAALHESLRATFDEIDGRHVQIIGEPKPTRLPVIDLSGLDETLRRSEAERLHHADNQRPFDLVNGPPIRLAALRLAPSLHIMLVNMHHIIADGWSMSVLQEDLRLAYMAYVHGAEPNLPVPELQYADFAAWQREQLQGAELERQLSYWTEQLQDAPTLELPTDKPRPPRQTFNGAEHGLTLSPELSAKVQSLSSAAGATPFMTLLAAFAATLGRYADQDDIVVGTPVGNRNRAELERMIGCLLNTLALRVHLDRVANFREAVAQTRDLTLQAFERQDLPFEKLVEELRPERDLSRSPIFQVMFVFQNAPGMNAGGGAPAAGGPTVSRFDLTLTVWVAGDRLAMVFNYNTDLFEEATVARLGESLRRLLEAALAKPDRPLNELPVMAAAERRQLLDAWAGRRTDYPNQASIPALFEAQAAKTPEARALIAPDDAEWTYGQLNARANRIAHALIERGVGPDALVGVCLEPGPDLIAGLLGALKAGGAYVPLDPGYPQERLAFMLGDTGMASLVADAAGLDALPSFELGFLDTLAVDEDEDVLAAQSEDNPNRAIDADNLAYVIYTSGSTGTPKGVAVSHRNVARLTQNTDYADFSPDRLFLQAAPASFDASTFEIWGPLLNGGALAIAPPLATDRLPELIRDRGVDTVWLTAQLFNLMVDNHLDALTGVRQLLAGGEALSPDHVRRFLEAVPECKLINGYGPTESTTFACCADLRAIGLTPFSAPIGGPIANTFAYVLDARLQPAPIGAFGELMIGGDGLARGYLNRSELTAERFIPHPHGDAPGARLYRTGDRVRWLANGAIEFAGRLDRQVKLRGFRIEPGEIEHCLKEMSAVQEAVVLVRGAGEDRRLVAYVVAGDPPPTPDEMRARLAGSLPEYMTPSAFVVLDALPLTPNGKLDRAALPDPEMGGSAAEYVEPATDTERRLAEIWQDVLKLERVGRNDDFFELGGHSLLATQAVSRIRDAFRAELPLKEIFERPTLAALAAHIDAVGGSAASAATAEPGVAADLPPIAPLPRNPVQPTIMPASFGQQRLWFANRLDPNNAAFNIPGIAAQDAPMAPALLELAVNAMAARHESLRTAFATHDGQPVQAIHPQLRYQLPVVDLSALDQADRETLRQRLTAENASRPFDLARGPLLRLLMIRADGRNAVLTCMHHIISDGWSLELFQRETGACYNALLRELPIALPPLPIQYADFAHWQRQWMDSDALEHKLGFWTDMLRGELPVSELPTDKPRPTMPSGKGGAVGFALDDDLSAALRNLGREHGASLFMTLLAAYDVLLARYSAQDDLIVGAPISGRSRSELEGLIGFFVNTLPLRVQLDDDPGFLDLLARVRRLTLDAFSHQDVPFDRVVEAVQPARDISRNPVFQVAFVLQNTPGAADSLSQDSDSGNVGMGAAQFDLCLQAVESTRGAISGSLQFSADLFERTTIERMRDHWVRLLVEIAADPQRRISDLSLMDQNERQRLIVELNRTDRDYDHTPAYRRFEDWAERAGEAPAVIDGDTAVSYAELDRRANGLARRLRDAGAGPERVVALCLDRSAALLAGMLAAHKAGAAYLPLDPANPDARLRFALDDAEAVALLVDPAHEARFGDWDGPTLTLDRDAKEAESAEPLHGEPGDLAYLIYTSGSTGQPKGVAVGQDSLANLAAFHQREFGFEPGARVSMVAGPAFDAAVGEIWPALAAGAALCVAPEEARSEPKKMAAWLAEAAITHCFCPTPLAEALLAEELPDDLPLKLLWTGGDRLRTRPAPEFPAAFINNYGPSENTVAATFAKIEPGLDAVPPIGRPAPNNRIFLLDRGLNPVPIGVVGELYIGGASLARGYFRRPDLTAERFIPHPFDERPGARLYRTGDLARCLANGDFDFAGRADNQIKIRGFRIEPGEIEAALMRRDDVGGAVVLAVPAPNGGRVLAAYLESPQASLEDEPRAAWLEEIRAGLKRDLPDYMVPSALLPLEALPLTPNGKIDRRALPSPELALREARPFIAPRNPTEKAVVEIWQELLERTQISVNDNFFELGGHSLMMARVTARLKEAFQVDFPIKVLFEHPDAASLAAYVDFVKWASSEPPEDDDEYEDEEVI